MFERVREAVSRSSPTQLDRMQRRELPDGWDADLPDVPRRRRRASPAATSSGKVLNAIAQNVPWLIGGSADLAPSTKTRLDLRGRRRLRGRAATAGATSTSASASTRMGAILNGMALVEGAAVRLRLPHLHRLRRAARSACRALMEMPVIYIFTHDSIGVGEDGPTHQPVEQLASLRAIPGLIDHPARRRQRGRRGVARRSCSCSTSRWRWC